LVSNITTRTMIRAIFTLKPPFDPVSHRTIPGTAA
jgi:hypothetical protein